MQRAGPDRRYGTIDSYMSLVNTDDQTQWPTYSGDFFPLGTNNNIYTSQIDWNLKAGANSEYWTGHYTTRPLMKGLAAKADAAKHTTDIAASIACAVGAGPHMV